MGKSCDVSREYDLNLSVVLSGAPPKPGSLETPGAKSKDPDNASLLIADSGSLTIKLLNENGFSRRVEDISRRISTAKTFTRFH